MQHNIFAKKKIWLVISKVYTKIFGELLCVERGTHKDDLEVVSEVEQVLHNDEQNIRLQASLVDLI